VGVTLWSVDSQASSEIHTRFFWHLENGSPLAVALCQAKLELLSTAEEDEDLEHFRHPFFWAPFVIFGDGR
jgi:CHAT domain-containing protein